MSRQSFRWPVAIGRRPSLCDVSRAWTSSSQELLGLSLLYFACSTLSEGRNKIVNFKTPTPKGYNFVVKRVKYPHCPMAASAEYRSKCHSPVMVTSPYEWKILECEVKPQTNKQANKQKTYLGKLNFFSVFKTFIIFNLRIKNATVYFFITWKPEPFTCLVRCVMIPIGILPWGTGL